MSFTYSDVLSTTTSIIRFSIGDTAQDSGPRPARANFSDNEIAYTFANEGSTINAAVAGLFEILAAEWAGYAMSESNGDKSRNASGTSEQYRLLAAQWRAKPGGSSVVNRSQSVATLTRTDAYTDNGSDYTW